MAVNAKRWQDWVLVVLGIWTFVSPFWMAGYASHASVAAGNAYILGILVVGFAWAALATARRWEDWVELILGIWLIIAPFVLRFWTNEHGAGVNQLIVGILVALDAIWALRDTTAITPRVTGT
jgi:hypothetical protein